MRILFNLVLVIIGVSFLGLTGPLIGQFFPSQPDDFSWSRLIVIFLLWLGLLVFFVLIYIQRTRWLKNIGIYKSWSNFKAFIVEIHSNPVVSEEDMQQFIMHTKPPEKRPANFLRLSRDIYDNLLSQLKEGRISAGKYKLFIKCLASYMGRWSSRVQAEHLGFYISKQNVNKKED